VLGCGDKEDEGLYMGQMALRSNELMKELFPAYQDSDQSMNVKRHKIKSTLVVPMIATSSGSPDILFRAHSLKQSRMGLIPKASSILSLSLPLFCGTRSPGRKDEAERKTKVGY
jgi:hypothetical protein